MVCDAEVCVVEDFVDAINIHRGNIFVQEINKIEIKDVSFPLPETFVRLQTDDLKDIGRKLDKGNVFLEYLGIGQDKLVEGQERGFKELKESQDNIVKILKEISNKL